MTEKKKSTKTLTNAKFAQRDESFMKACSKVGIPPTSRQASKWRMKKGLAWKKGRK